MKTFEKKYIAKGKQVNGMQIVRVSFKMSEIQEHVHEYKGEQYLTFEVAKLQNPDKMGNEYTVYVNKLVETEEKAAQEPPAKNAPKEKAPKKVRKQAKTEDDEIPF